MVIFDSRNAQYRAPFGAVAEGTQVHFRVRLPRSFGCKGVTLKVYDEFACIDTRLKMFWCGADEENSEWWEVDFTPKTASLYYYHFELDAAPEYRFIGKGESSYGCITDNPYSWQLTVFEKQFTTPEWMAGGIMYQVFPDSFCKSKTKHRDVPSDRIMEKWGTQPYWRPENGVITNKHFFGGDLDGIREKLKYIASLGVTCLYLNPIFEAHENHRYNTADYSKIDPMLGDERTFKKLCSEANALGIKVILDGVFSHTGSDSIYFNRLGRYGDSGAYNSQKSEYYGWYNFKNWPNEYDAWWGIGTMPELKEDDPAVLEYITGPKGIVRKWLKAGASGWRLDVADELPDKFLDCLRAAAKAEKSDAVVIGEVWEDASNKIAYSKRRRYLLGKQLDSVMNYPFKNAIIGFMTGMDAKNAAEIVMSVLEHYPPQVSRTLMNLIGTHDTERSLTLLAGKTAAGHDREWQSQQKLSPDERKYAKLRYKLATVLQYTLPGVPSIYYGDEAGVEGLADPFNRESYPWGKEDTELIEWHRFLGSMRKGKKCLMGADMSIVRAQGRVLCYTRSSEDDAMLVAVNLSDNTEIIEVPERFSKAKALVGCYNDGGVIAVGPQSCTVLLAK